MKKMKLFMIALVLTVFSNHALTENTTNRCWVPNNSQVEAMQMFREARKKGHQRDEILKEITISEAQRQDPAFIRAAMECGIFSLYHDNSVLKKNKEFVLTLLRQEILAFGHIDKSLTTDWDVALTAIQYDPIAAWDVPLSLKTNQDFTLKALRESPYHGWDILKILSWRRDDRETVLLAVKSYGGILSQVDERFWEDKEIVQAAAKSLKAHYNRLVNEGIDAEGKVFKDYNVLEELANGRDIPLLSDPDVIEAANTKEIETLPFQERCPNHCSEYK